MIYLYTGKTGSGKTFSMVKDIYPQWFKGRDIYSNTKLFFEKFGGKANSNIIDNPENFNYVEKTLEAIKKKYCSLAKKSYKPKRRGRIVYFDDITELIELKDGIICMDEAQSLLDARNWENLPMEFSNKLRQHRKHKLDLYATTQNMGTIDINMRRLVQRWVHSKDLFALFWIRNPSLLTLHKKEVKDIDYLYNSVDDLQVPTLTNFYFFIHPLKKRYYDTLYDIGFKAYKVCYIEKDNRRKIIILPKNWTLSNARTQSLLLKFYLDQNKFSRSKMT